MVYIKLENSMDKFMENFTRIPKSAKKFIYKSKCRNGKFYFEKKEGIEFVVLPTINEKILSKLNTLAKVRCWRNVCVSDNLKNSEAISRIAKENDLRILSGKWLMKIMVDKILEYIVEMKNEVISNKEVTILCNNIDETCLEKIKEIAANVKICNVLTNNQKQFQKLEEEFYQIKGIILNVSNNYKKSASKSNIIINFDFTNKDLEKCVFQKNAYIINLCENELKKDLKNITFAEIVLPEKYKKSVEDFDGFNNMSLYESFIYKNTSYKNLKKEIFLDGVEIVYLIDFEGKIIKNSNLNFGKTLDKIVI